MNKRTISIGIVVSLAIIIPVIIYLIHNSPTALAAPSINKDPNLKVETLISGLDSPTSMAFIDNNNILVLEKSGHVRLVSNGALQDNPVLQVSVNTASERGLVGIAIINNTTETNPTALNNNNKSIVFLYYTESNGTDLRNRVYRYDWNAQTQTLINPTLILDLPGVPGPNHDVGNWLLAQTITFTQ